MLTPPGMSPFSHLLWLVTGGCSKWAARRPTTSPQNINSIPTKTDLFPTGDQPKREGLSHSRGQTGSPHSSSGPTWRPKTHYPRLEDGIQATLRVEPEAVSFLPAGPFARRALVLGLPSQNRLLNGGIVFHAMKCCPTDVFHARRIARTAGLPQRQPREIGTPVYGSVLRPPFE